MRAVRIKVLKDNLSKYLRYVREGETVLVMDRDTVIAEIHRPVHPVANLLSPWEAFLNDAERRGAVRRATTERDAGNDLAALSTLPRPPRPVDLKDLLAGLRAE